MADLVPIATFFLLIFLLEYNCPPPFFDHTAQHVGSYSQTRDWTLELWRWSRVLTTGPPGKTPLTSFKDKMIEFQSASLVPQTKQALDSEFANSWFLLFKETIKIYEQ